MKTLADQVREFLEREGITSTEMARRCGVSRQNVDNVLKGTQRIKWLPQLADAMGTTVDALLTGKPASRFVVRGSPWPLEFLTREHWARLTPAQRAVVDHAALKAAEQFLRGNGGEDSKRQTGT